MIIYGLTGTSQRILLRADLAALSNGKFTYHKNFTPTDIIVFKKLNSIPRDCFDFNAARKHKASVDVVGLKFHAFNDLISKQYKGEITLYGTTGLGDSFEFARLHLNFEEVEKFALSNEEYWASSSEFLEECLEYPMCLDFLEKYFGAGVQLLKEKFNCSQE